MREGVPSLTAMLVSFARGFSGAARGDCRDPYAAELLPAPIAGTLRVARAAARGRPWVEAAISRATLDTLAHVGLRTGEIDEAVDEAAARGVRQLVLVGAGLDARAFRLASLRGARVFEVDHPSTQALKRRKVAGLSPLAASVAYVDVDFGRQSLRDRLLEAGFDRTSPATFVWEGVTMYLPREATVATLEAIAGLSAPGSRLVLTYVEPRFSALPEAFLPVMHALFATVGEPLLGAIAPEELARLVAGVGLRLVRDTTSASWRDHALGETVAVRLFERVAVADRDA